MVQETNNSDSSKKILQLSLYNERLLKKSRLKESVKFALRKNDTNYYIYNYDTSTKTLTETLSITINDPLLPKVYIKTSINPFSAPFIQEINPQEQSQEPQENQLEYRNISESNNPTQIKLNFEEYKHKILRNFIGFTYGQI